MSTVNAYVRYKQTANLSNRCYVRARLPSSATYFASFPNTAAHFAKLAKIQLAMPVLSIGWAKANGLALRAQVKLVASDVTAVVLKGTGHRVLEERRDETIAALVRSLQ